MQTSPEIEKIAAALAKAQGAIEGAVKGKENPHYRSKYADLWSVWDACRTHLSANEIAVLQPIARIEDGVSVIVTRLVHSSGQWMQDGGTPLVMAKQDMQGLGSAITYARRYGLMSMVGIAPEDDDAEGAVRRPTTQSVAVPQEPAGFGAWWEGAQDAATEGTETMKKVWTSARPEYRQYITKNFISQWEALKARAAKHDVVPA